MNRHTIAKNTLSVAVGVRGLPTGEVTKRSGVETKYEFRRLNLFDAYNITCLKKYAEVAIIDYNIIMHINHFSIFRKYEFEFI